jgi:hypothetical protein
MNGDEHVEQMLHRLTPRGAAPELREQVLAAVGRELSAERPSRWQRRLGLAVAASILLGIVLNMWANKATDRRLARLYGPPPTPRQIAEVAEMVASVTDAQTGRRVRQQLSAAWWSRPTAPIQSICSSQQILEELEITRKEQRHEDPQDRRRGDRDTSDCQRDLGLEDRLTA